VLHETLLATSLPKEKEEGNREEETKEGGQECEKAASDATKPAEDGLKTDASMTDAADASAPAGAKPKDARPADAKPEDAKPESKDAESDVKHASAEAAKGEAANDEPEAEKVAEAAKDDKVFCLSLAGVCACASLVCLALRVAYVVEADVFFLMSSFPPGCRARRRCQGRA
jgi:hypothetical protein